jgi:peroxiredoxin
MNMSLQAELDALMADVRTKVPADVLAPIERFYAKELHHPDRVPKALTVGQQAPDFALPDAMGRTIRLTQSLGEGPIIVSFYRGAWCPFCNIELRALQKALPQIRALGGSLVAISPELPDNSVPLVEREHLEFPVLSDLGNTVARQFGLVFQLEGEVRRVSLEVFGVDLPSLNGDASWEIPVPATYLIDRNGIVRFAYFDADFRNRVDPAQLLHALATL